MFDLTSRYEIVALLDGQPHCYRKAIALAVLHDPATSHFCWSDFHARFAEFAAYNWALDVIAKTCVENDVPDAQIAAAGRPLMEAVVRAREAASKTHGPDCVAPPEFVEIEGRVLRPSLITGWRRLSDGSLLIYRNGDGWAIGPFYQRVDEIEANLNRWVARGDIRSL